MEHLHAGITRQDSKLPPSGPLLTLIFFRMLHVYVCNPPHPQQNTAWDSHGHGGQGPEAVKHDLNFSRPHGERSCVAQCGCLSYLCSAALSAISSGEMRHSGSPMTESPLVLAFFTREERAKAAGLLSTTPCGFQDVNLTMPLCLPSFGLSNSRTPTWKHQIQVMQGEGVTQQTDRRCQRYKGPLRDHVLQQSKRQ